MSEIHCRFTGEVRSTPELRHSERSGRTWCRLMVAVAAGSLGDIGVLAFGGRAQRICETMHAGDTVAVEGRLSLWVRDDQSTALSVISKSIELVNPHIPHDVANHRARRGDAEAVLGREG